MRYKDEDIIYILTKTDVDDVAKEIGVKNLTTEHYRSAQKSVEGYSENGWWSEAIEDGLRNAEDELQKKLKS